MLAVVGMMPAAAALVKRVSIALVPMVPRSVVYSLT